MVIKENLNEFIFTDSGINIEYDHGDVIDSLKVIKYIGKKYASSYRRQLVPMYLCKCNCGMEVIRSQAYLKFNKNPRRCNSCANRSAIKKKKANPGGKKKGIKMDNMATKIKW